MTAPTATADDLNQQREQVTAQLAQSQQALGESTQELQQAAVAVLSAQSQLDAAQDRLAATRQELSAARAKDVALAAKLKVARHKLALAKAAVIAGQRKLDAEKASAGEMVRDQYQQQTSLLPIAMLVASESTADIQTRLQWSTTMFDTTQAQIDRLTVVQRTLTAQRARQALLEKEIAEDRQVAAKNLILKKALERRAASQTAEVAGLLRQRTAVRASAAVAVAQDRQQVVELNRERASVEQRIAARIAQAKAEAVRKARAARAAKLAAQRAAAGERAEKVAAAKRARKAANAQQSRVESQEKASRSSSKKSSSKKTSSKKSSSNKSSDDTKRSSKKKAKKRSSSSGSSRHHGFIYPVSGPMTSAYGRRFHPVLHIWKLHDGTDFSGGCGTPIRAAYSGRVAERYYNGAYGNRLMIDHGRVDGRYVTTGYNHATRYKVRVGQRVRKGQVVGYVGSTGYSTGCHLHLMVWLDGNRVNPMSWY
jgi:murein DD-endopeptidase MepM/ murein hydrolase activator NlpD